jgi:thioredoxin reductase
MLDIIIIGAGPYGISIAAHAAARHLSYKLLGYPMDFWKNQMPQNMFIRTPPDLVSFSDPKGEFTIQRYSLESNTKLESPMPRTVFVQYASWFAEKAGVEFTPEWVESLSYNGNCYSLTTESGQQLTAKNVVIATGIKDFQYIPKMFNELSSKWVSHTLGYTSFKQFREKNIIVVGSGQSAWEAAALLHEAKANVQLVFRNKAPVYGGNRVEEVVLKKIGNIFFKLPRLFKKKIWHIASVTVPIAHFLRSYVEGKVSQVSNVSVVQSFVDDDRIQLKLSNGSMMNADHVIVASGFKINLERLPFLEKDLKSKIIREEDYAEFPKLNRYFESNCKGLYFAGPLSSHSHGPTFRFILGLEKTAKTIISSI